MSDPATDARMQLDEHPQDPAAASPRVPLARVLDLMRVLAGRRGSAGVQWSGSGFVYSLTAERGAPVPLELDPDPTATNVAADLLVEVLYSLDQRDTD
jgi:hypothetical protein